MAKKEIDALLNEIRNVMSRYGHLPERMVYEALVEEAEGWSMRLQELEEDEGDG